MKKPAPTFRADDADLFQLFDIGEMEHVCDLLANMADPVPEKEREAMAKTLRDLLGVPIERLRNRIFESGRGTSAAEYESLDRFAQAVEVTAQSLASSPAMNKDKAREIADDLHIRWLGFIAYGSAFRMYHDLPRELVTNKRRTAPMRDKRDALAYGAGEDHKRVISRYAELAAAKVRGIRKKLAAEFGYSENTIKNIWNKREK